MHIGLRIHPKYRTVFLKATIIGGLVIFIICLIFWRLNSPGVLSLTSSNGGITDVQNKVSNSHEIIDKVLMISGRIEPHRTKVIISPFEGVIKEVFVTIGNSVLPGQKLIEVETSLIDEKLREEKSAYIKAKIAYDKILSWSSGAEMQRARRTLDEAKSSLAKAENDMNETKGLLDQGIVPRNEYEAAVQEYNSKKNLLAAAQDEFRTIQSEGGKEQLEMARLELENTKSRLSSTEADRKNNIIYSDIGGIIISPPKEAGGRDNDISIVASGVHLQKGSVIYNVADVSSFVVVGDVDEVDVNHIVNGQIVTIESDALPGKIFTGRLHSVSAEASKDAGFGQVPKFKVFARFDVNSNDERRLIKLGMTAQMRIQLEPAYVGRVVPIELIQNINIRPRLMINRGGQIMDIDVKIGETTPLGIEIIDGLKENDEIIVPH